METIHLARLQGYRATEHNSFLPHSGDDVMVSEGEDDCHVVIHGDEERRHLGEWEHQGGGHAGGETGGARHDQGGQGQVCQDQVQQEEGHQGNWGEQVDGQKVQDETENRIKYF